MDKSLFFNTLFDEGEYICSGTYKAVNVSDKVHGNFFCINPLKERRKDLNVTCYRNFLFEIDTLDLDTQLNIWRYLNIPITSLVYSGGKSYHAIISLQEPLMVEEHTNSSVTIYKEVWERMRQVIEATIGSLNVTDDVNVIDSSCKNPSRLSRVPDAIRENGNKQYLNMLNPRISKELFFKFFKFNYDDIKEPSKNYSSDSDFEITDTYDFWRVCPIGLKNKLRYVDWADSAGMYPEILKLAYWAIDSTGVDKDTLIEALWERTFPRLVDAGYPSEKLTVAIDHAYNEKRRS